MNTEPNAKRRGAYYTPDGAVATLMRWAVRSADDRLLDPACGDGRFLAHHRNSVGIEQDLDAARQAMERAPGSLIHEGDFFAWAANTKERFDCAAGNPPFIRYQTFKGEVRARALALCARLGAQFSALSSSWAPFLVATAGVLKPGGRMAFVVPAEIGHAPYAAPLLDHLVGNFAVVHVVAFREKMFPDLSEDCWLLFAEGRGDQATAIRFTALDGFKPMAAPPRAHVEIPLREWRATWQRRLRPFLLPAAARDAYATVLREAGTRRLGDCAAVGIGYVSGDNAFFHLRPSQADALDIPPDYLMPSVRSARLLPERRLTPDMVEGWRADDQPMLLLNLPKAARLPRSVQRYLSSEAAEIAQAAYKCRNRDPWYSVPDVTIPDLFLTYMSGRRPALVENAARCTCPNALHAVRLKPGFGTADVTTGWDTDFTALSCELEGHPLGGGMLKLEPREAARVALPGPAAACIMPAGMARDALATMRAWRHLAG